MREYARGECIDGRWQVRRVLQGGLGRVYIVMDLRDEIPLALKTFQVEQADPDVIARFRQEAYTWVQIGNHPNLVRAHYYMPYNDEHYLFLEYVDGGDLSGWIGTSRLSDRATLLRLGLQFCDGMIHANSHGMVVHRDIKAQNCMMTSDGDLKITDFGLAKASGARLEERNINHLSPPSAAVGLTGAGQMMGTITHMAPEQFNDAAQVDVRADVYSFGVMLYEMATGHLPFQAPNPWALAVLHNTKPPPRLQDVGLDAVVQACLAKRPEDRPGDFTQLRELLANLYARSLHTAPPPPARAGDFDILELDRRATCLLSLGYHEQAVQLLEQGLQARPDRRQLWVTMGHACNQLRRPQQALAHLQKALAMGENASTFIEVGLALELLGEAQQAESAYRRAVELDEGYAQGYYSLGALQAGQGRLREAVDDFQRAINLAPEMGGFRVGLGMALMNAGLPEQAAEAFISCLQRDSTHAGAWARLGVCQSILGDPVHAEQSLRRAIALQPQDGEHWLTLGRILHGAKNLEEALQCCLRAQQLDPQSPGACELVGRLYLQRGNSEEGLRNLQQAHELGSTSAGQMLATLRRGLS